MRAETTRRKSSWLGPLVRDPLVGILVTVAALRAIGLGWGLPGSDGWDNDGVAPRDFLPGLAETFTPGHFYTYPPLHLAILGVLTLPITLVAVARAPSRAIPDVVATILDPVYMTSFAVVARLVALAMSLGIVVAVARLTEELHAHALGVAPVRGGRFGSHFEDPRVRRAGLAAAAFVGTNVSLAYYGKTSNLDVPYLFWATLGLVALARALARAEPRRLRGALVFVACAAATKDQAAALFVLSVPLAVLGTLRRATWRRWLGELVVAGALAGVVLLAIDGALVNPRGFRARLAFLTGPASKDYVTYTNDWAGRLGVLVDAGRRFELQYPYVAAPVILYGLWRGARSVVGALPLLAAASFTVAFNWSALRTDARFLLPHAVVLAVYGGLGLEGLVFAAGRVRRLLGQAYASVVLAHGLFRCAALDENLLADPRYDVERWLAENVKPGETIETYGLNVYLPRFPAHAHVVRVAPTPVEKRNPLPGVEEVSGRYEDAPARGAQWIVLPTAWGWRYFNEGAPRPAGRILPPTVARQGEDEAASRYFQDLIHLRSIFAYVHGRGIESKVFPVVDIHGTTGRVVWVYRRRD